MDYYQVNPVNNPMYRMIGGKSSSVIFVGNDQISLSSLDNERRPYQTRMNWPILSSIKFLFMVSLKELPGRIFLSLVPPIGNRYKHVYVDLLGPILALLLMAGILHYGHASKLPSAAPDISPITVLLIYALLLPLAAYYIAWLGGSKVTLTEMFALLGYGMFGHVFTLAVSLIFYQEESNVFFFLCLIVFGGLSALRVALILLASISVPAARLLVCSLVATVQLLSLVFLHFAYMHRTFLYGSAELHTRNVGTSR